MSERQTRLRQRQERRKQQSGAPRRAPSTRQTAPVPSGGVTLPRVSLPSWWRWLVLLPFGVVIVWGVIAVLRNFNPPPELIPNAIWLNAAWTYDTRTDDEWAALIANLREHQIGTVYAYVSALKADNTWAGRESERNLFSEVEPNVRAFVERLKRDYSEVSLYAWIEVRADTPTTGYRLNNPQVQQASADFSLQALNNLGFAGIMIDAQPVFDDNNDLLTFLRAIRQNIGLETPLAVAVPPDFTPLDANITPPPQIAPNTVWSTEYKQRVALQANTLVVMAYNSYLSNPLDYINWVMYQVQSYLAALEGMNTGAQLVISIPNYADNSPAHLSAIESMPAALDGVRRGLPVVAVGDTTSTPLTVYGVAIFTDSDLSASDWAIFREKWLD